MISPFVFSFISCKCVCSLFPVLAECYCLSFAYWHFFYLKEHWQVLQLYVFILIIFIFQIDKYSYQCWQCKMALQSLSLSICCRLVIMFLVLRVVKQCSDHVVLQGSVNTSLETLQLLASGSTNLSKLKKQQKSSLLDSEEKDSKATLSHQVRQVKWRHKGS